MAEVVHVCETCKSQVYTDLCDACGAVIERAEQGSKMQIATRRGEMRYDLRVVLCLDCETRALDMRELQDHIIDSWGPPYSATTPSPS